MRHEVRIFLRSALSISGQGEPGYGSSSHTRRSHLLAFFLLLLTLFILASTAQKPKGKIEGIVLDEQGQPVKNIGVQALLERTGKYMPGANSDDEGRFQIKGLEAGTYDIFGESDADAYPNTAIPFYSSAEPEKAKLEGDDLSATVVLHLGPRAGILTGTVIDQATGKTVISRYNLHFTLKRLSYPDQSIEIMNPPNFRLLIPPGVRVALEVSADGYKPWFYADPLNPAEHLPLRLESGQEMTLVITLEPISEESPREQ
jgi:hypothetical protein